MKAPKRCICKGSHILKYGKKRSYEAHDFSATAQSQIMINILWKIRVKLYNNNNKSLARKPKLGLGLPVGYWPHVCPQTEMDDHAAYVEVTCG